MKTVSTIHAIATLLLLCLSHTAQSNDSILLLTNEQRAMDYKMNLMMQAQKSISMSYYAINEDEVGLKFAAIACYKAQQGIKVNIIIEKSRSKVTHNLMQLFKEYGINIKYYNSFRVQKTIKNFSWLHDKLLVVDALYTVVGGRNLNNKYYPNATSPTKLTDIETLIKGQTGADAQYYVEQLLASKYADDVRIKKIDSTHYLLLKNVIKQNIDSIPYLYQNHQDTILMSVATARFVHDDYSQWTRSKTVTNTIYQLITQAQKNLTIVSPYLIPPCKYLKALKKASKKGVQISLISNSPQVSDAKIIAAAYMNDRRKYLKHHIKVLEYNGTKMLHDKLFLADDSIAIIGSYNFDNISHHMNAEIIVEIKDTAFANQIKKHIIKREEECFEVKHPKDKNPYNDKAIAKRTRWNQILLKLFPFIRRFL